MTQKIRYHHPYNCWFYKVGDDGSVWSRRIERSRTKSGPWRRLKTYLTGGNAKIVGYPTVALFIKGVKRQVFVHKLVLEAFVGPCPVGMECLHEDDNPENSHLSNLRWGTHKQNLLDASKRGRLHKGKPEDKKYCPRCKTYLGVRKDVKRRCYCKSCERNIERERWKDPKRRAYMKEYLSAYNKKKSEEHKIKKIKKESKLEQVNLTGPHGTSL